MNIALRILVQCDRNFDLKLSLVSVGQWPLFHGLVILSCILKTIWWMNVVLEILLHYDTNLDLLIYVCHWPIFRGTCTVILPYILNSMWWTSLIFGYWFSVMAHWPIFHDLAILHYIPISAYSGLLKFDMKMFINVARLEIGQLFTQGMRWGHPCTLDTFVVLS